jgi:hypothetical protein
VNINVRIERLILDGIDIPRDGGPALQAAAEAELAELLTLGGLAPRLQAGGALPRVRGDSFQLADQASPTDLGRQIARAIYEGIG